MAWVCKSGERACQIARFLVGSRNLSSEAIKQLRERTGAPIKSVKDVLVQCNWDQDAAYTELRKKGLAAASKKASRLAADGLLGVVHSGNIATVVELNSETDFVARNDLFQYLVTSVAKAAFDLEVPTASIQSEIDLQKLKAVKISLDHSKLKGESTVEDAIAEVASITGENVRLRRGYHLAVPKGHVATYLHTSPQPGLARIAGFLAIETGGDASIEVLKDLGSSLAMHIVALKPLFLSKEHVTPQALQEEKDILRTQALQSGKPEAIIDKIIEGRLSKYYEDVVFLEQKYLLNDPKNESRKVKSVLSDATKELGGEIEVKSFLRVEVGEGIITKDEKDIEDVAQAV